MRKNVMIISGLIVCFLLMSVVSFPAVGQTGSGWASEVVTTTGFDGAMDLDSNGVPYVTYATTGADSELTLMYATNGSGAWSSSVADTNGNVGIRALTPAYRLHVHNASIAPAYMGFTSYNTGWSSTDGLKVGIDENGDGHVHNQEAGSLRFATFDVDRMTIDEDGRVGIGILAQAPPSPSGPEAVGSRTRARSGARQGLIRQHAPSARHSVK